MIRVRDLPQQLGRAPDQYVVFDPDPLLVGFRRRHFETASSKPRRRRFSPEYKLAVLREYEAAIEPGAKTGVLRREGLHTSHLVSWRRARDSRALRSERERG